MNIREAARISQMNSNGAIIKEATPQTDEAIPESKASLAKPAKLAIL
jgi:hypothetical protein